MKKLIELFKDVALPNICQCGKWGEALCDDCLSQIPKNKSGFCPICKRLSTNGKTCDTCRTKSYLTGVMVFGKHEGILKNTLWNFKYESIRDLSDPMGQLITEKFGDFFKTKKLFNYFCPDFNRKRELARLQSV